MKKSNRRSRSRSAKELSRGYSLNPYPHTIENIHYIRASLPNQPLDLAGNLDLRIQIADAASTPEFGQFQVIYQEYKILKMSVWINFFGSFTYNTARNYGTLFAVPYHIAIPASMTHQQALDVIDTKWWASGDPTPKKHVWTMKQDDASENEFVSTTSAPTTAIGGLYFWMDGPVTAATDTVCDVIVTYKMMFRGRR